MADDLSRHRDDLSRHRDDDDDALEALIARQIETRRAAGAVIGEEEEEAIREGVSKLVKSDTIGKLQRATKDGEAAQEFSHINFLNGLPGAMAMIKSLVNSAGLSKGKAKEFWRRLQLPFKTKPTDRGGLMISFGAPDENGVPKQREFHLHGGECSANHDFGVEFGKIASLANSEKDLQRIRDQCSLIVLFTRQAYVKILELNGQLFGEFVMPGFADSKISEGHDPDNTTIFLQKTGNLDGDAVPLEPRVGLFFTEK